MSKRGFTFIEILIALAVFSIGVLAVLRLVTSNLTTMSKTETRTVATFLAKEGLELVYNMRDANIQKKLPWNCLLTNQVLTDQFHQVDPDSACVWSFSSGARDGNVLSIGFSATGYVFAEQKSLASTFTGNFSLFALVPMSSVIGGRQVSRYGPGNPSQTGIIFSRYILFTGIQEGNAILPLQDVLKIESHVLYMRGSSVGELVLEGIIGRK